MKDLETLLNQLIKIGWKPWNKDKVSIISIVGEQLRLIDDNGFIYTPYSPRLRELVSLESGLYQFCVDKNLLPIEDCEWADNRWLQFTDSGFEYRLIESALVPEEELAQFLVDNINIK